MPETPAKPPFPWIKYIVKLERISAWILFLALIAYGVTGYGMTRGLIPKGISHTLHLGWLGAIILVPFIAHTSWGIRLSLGRRNMWNRATRVALAAFYVALVAFFLWAEFFYAASKPESSKSYPAVAESLTENSTDTVFTAETLKAYDGLDGRPAYVAVDGVVYDMSSVFYGGKHHGYSAGRDLSAEFHGAHPAGYLKEAPVVGSYKK